MNEDLENAKRISLRNKVRLELHDEDDVFISLIKDDKTVSKVNMPGPSAGYGGGSLLVSSSK